MKTLASRATMSEGISHLLRSDKKLASVMRECGKINFKPEGEMFESLVESILTQQLASPAANAIIKRVREIYGGKLLPREIYSTTPRLLKRAGVSPQKIRYLKDLSSRVVKGKLDLEGLRTKPENEIISALDEVLGVGPWTAHMLLIFTLGRTDVLPVDDLGIRKGIQKIYSLRALPDKEAIEKVAKKWHPYCSLASLYVWRFKDGKPQ